MLKTMRKYRRSVLGVVIVSVITMTMGGFGVDLIRNKSKPYAIKVGERDVSYERYAQVRRSIESRYRQMFGENADQFIKTLGINTAQQAVDSAIESEIMLDFADRLGLQASDKAVQELLINDVFQGQFDAQRYASFLSAQGLTAKQFEDNLKQDVVRRQLVSVFEASSKPSIKETKSQMLKEKTAYSFRVASLDPQDLKSGVAEPSAEEIGKFYDDNLTDFQTPAAISYKYIVLKPDDFLNKVPVADEDIEIEYSDNQSQYMTEAEVRFSQIVFKFPENAPAEKKDLVKKAAAEVSKKLKEGAKFEDLARAESQDVGSALKAGDAGWQTKASLPKAVAEKAFALEVGAVSEEIETDKAVYIIRLDDLKEPRQKELAEVKDDIKNKIQVREAPSILALEAEEMLDKWSKSETTLEDFAKQAALPAVKEADRLEASADPSAELKGLTAQVIGSAQDKKQLVELGDRQVLIEVQNFFEEAVKSLDQVKPQIVDKLKSQSAKTAAQNKMEEILKGLNQPESKGLTDAAKTFALKTEEILEVTQSSAKGLVAEPQVRDVAFAVNTAPQLINQIFTSGDKLALVEVISIKAPTAEDVEKALKGTLSGMAREQSELALEAFLAQRKANTKIDIQPSLLAS